MELIRKYAASLLKQLTSLLMLTEPQKVQKLFSFRLNANNINVRHMQTEARRAEGRKARRGEDWEDFRPVAVAIAYEECQVRTVG